MSRPDFDPEEMEFRREIEPAMGRICSAAGPCPEPDLLMAASAGVAVANSEAIREHIARCPLCAQLSDDLAAYEFPGVTEAEDRRIRVRWQERAAARRSASIWAWFWRPAPAAAFAVLALAIGLTVWKTSRVQQPSAPAVASRAPSESPGPSPVTPAFVLQKPPIKVPMAAILVYRSSVESSQVFLKDLARALEPYRSDDYAEAARRLESVSAKYPIAAEPLYYLGVSQLFLSQNESAIGSLQTARRLASVTLRDDVSWYLALAFHRAGRTEDGRREVETLCARAGEYKKQACSALARLQVK